MNESIHIDFWKGQLFELLTPDKETFFTQLLEHDSNLLVQRPVNQKNIPLTMNNELSITVYFYDDINGLCSFHSKMHHLQNNKFLISTPHHIKKAQRRRFFRVQTAVEMRLLLPSFKDVKANTLKTLTHDLSGGGVSFLSSTKIMEEGVIVKGHLHFDQKKVEFQARVVKVIKKQNQIFRNSLQFIEISESSRSEIIRFCMLKQIELRKITV